MYGPQLSAPMARYFATRAIVLLVDVDDYGRQMYGEYLRICGFRLMTADTTDDGFTRAPDADVVVIGIHVPGSFDGIELVRRLREVERTRQTPIIVLAAWASEPDQERAFLAGCDAFLGKPCLPNHRLLAEVHRLLARPSIPLRRGPLVLAKASERSSSLKSHSKTN